MLDRLISSIAPHLCCSCGSIGQILCDSCKYDITSEDFGRCIACLTPSVRGVCRNCTLPYSAVWCVGARDGVLERLIDRYKFDRAHAASVTVAGLLDEILPELPPETVLVPVPTIARHIRQRGYDHAALIANQLAKRRKLFVLRVIGRRHDTVQLGKSRAVRARQAAEAFTMIGPVTADVPYLVIDDIFTTGATVAAVSKLLRDAGATEVWVAVIARQMKG